MAESLWKEPPSYIYYHSVDVVVERQSTELGSACRYITRGTNEGNAKLGQRGSGRGHVTYF